MSRPASVTNQLASRLLVVVVFFAGFGLYGAESKTPMALDLAWFADSSRRLGVEEVAGLDGEFVPFVKGETNWKTTEDRMWLRVIPGRAFEDDELIWVDYVPLERICLHWPEGESFASHCTGTASSFDTRDLDYARFAFFPPAGLAEGTPFFIEVETEFPLKIPVRVLHVADFHRINKHRLIEFGLAFGALSAVAIFSLFFAIGLKSRSHFYYSIHLSLMTLALAGFEGLGAQALWPHSVLFRRMPLAMVSLSFLFGCFFVRRFLETKGNRVALDRILTGSAILGGIGFVVALFGTSPGLTASAIAAIGFGAASLVAGAIRLRERHRPALYLLVAMVAPLVILMLKVLEVLYILPTGFQTPSLFLWSYVVGALLLSFGLADRVKTLMDDRARIIPELETKTAEMERFTYAVSHDLKAPLITIRGFLGLLRRSLDAGDRSQANRDMERVDQAAAHMQTLLEELLNLSRVGRVASLTEVFSLSRAAGEAITLFTLKIVGKGVDVRIAKDLPTILGDRARMCDVFQNLIGNAIKFTERVPHPLIEIGVEGAGYEAVCYVRDNGEGIEERYLDRIFDLLYRADSVHGGSGIGLALVKRIVEVHGGRIWAESDGLGKGATFKMRLPWQEPGSSE